MSTAPANKILVFGATGLIGGHIINAIIASKAKFTRIAAFTSPNTLSSKAAEIDRLKTAGVEIIAGDLSNESEVNKAYGGIDTVVSCLGRPAIPLQAKLIELAEKHSDVKRFLPSEYGTDIEYSPASASEKPHQEKLKIRALLKTVKNLQYTYVVTGPYGDADDGLYLSASKPEAEKYGTFDVARKRAVLLGDGDGKISLTTMRDVGKLVVAALTHPENAHNRALHVNSFTATPHELVAEFEKQTDSKWKVSYTSVDELKKLENEAWGNGAPLAGYLTLKRIWTTGGTLYEERDNGLIGMEDGVDSLQSAVDLAIKVQRGSSS